jgi:uncharacterized protein (UPF0276 family)
MAADDHQGQADPIPASAGIGLRGPHYRELADRLPTVGWLEAHSENFFGEGGAPHRYLEALRRDYPLSLHGVGLSLGSVDPLDTRHLQRLQALVTRYQPALISEHLSWSSANGLFSNDLLPLPYTEEALDHFSDRVARTQEALGRQILIENPSSYLRYDHSTIDEWTFLVAVAERGGCGLLLDVNNVYVSAENHDYDAREYLDAIPRERVGEIHLAGHAVNRYGDRTILIDDHGGPVAEPVWALFEYALQRFAGIPTLIEWDSNIPELDVLLAEAGKAQRLMERADAVAA